LLAFYGQHEHRKLMLASAQLDVLDAHCGEQHLALRGRVRLAHDRVRGLESRVEQLRELAGARDRELDLLTFELGEIEAAHPSEEEEAELVVQRDRLRHLESLRSAAAVGAEAIAPEAGDGGVGFLLARACDQIESVSGIDPRLAPLAERLQALRYEAEDLGAELRRYVEGTEGEPGGLEEVEERLGVLARLQRKHGGSIAAVLEHAERCRERRDELEHADVALEVAESELAEASAELQQLAGELGRGRAEAAPALAAAVRERLAELAMPDASFEVRLDPRPDGCGPRGAEAVELLIAPNAGVPAGPLREIASGGELSRVMLALLSVAHSRSSADAPVARVDPLLVFDEIDAGIGGHTARAVGEHLRALAAGRQILCITHLPQVASLAERHFRIEKAGGGGTATTSVTELAGDDVVGELVRMLGAGEGDRAASQHARRLLRAA
jgi:DNA repair protein RecN (Recombination protein N)